MNVANKAHKLTEKDSSAPADATVGAGNYGGASFKLSSRLVWPTITSDIVDGLGVKLLLTTRNRFLGLEGDLVAWLVLLWDVLRHGDCSEERYTDCCGHRLQPFILRATAFAIEDR